MGRENKKRRSMFIRQAQKRQTKLKKLRKSYTKAKDSSKKEQLLEKVYKIAPWLTKEEFLKSTEDRKKSDEKPSSI